jgi:hypothetical protein
MEENDMEAVVGGIIFGLIIIAILEICRHWRLIGRSSREIQALQKRVEELEEKLENLKTQ